jgi:hypothetical protein
MKLSRILPLVVGTATVGILASSASPAQALLVTVNGTDYNVSTVTQSYNQNPGLLQSQPWWGSQSLATQFATQVGLAFGSPNSFGIFGNRGPLFAYNASPTDSPTEVFTSAFDFMVGAQERTVNPQTTYVFAIATEATPTPIPFDIPGGATIPTVGSLFALALMRQARKSIASKNRIANTVTTKVG